MKETTVLKIGETRSYMLPQLPFKHESIRMLTTWAPEAGRLVSGTQPPTTDPSNGCKTK